MCTDARRGGALYVLALLLLLAKSADAQQSPAPGNPAATSPADTTVRLSLRDAVTAASTTTPAVTVAVLQEEEARGRVTQARSIFFPSLTGAASFVRRTENLKSFGFSFPLPPGSRPLPDLI